MCFVMDLRFRIYFADQTTYLSKTLPVGERDEEITVYEETVDHIHITWRHTKHANGALVDMDVSSDRPLQITRIDSVVLSIGQPEITDHIAVIGRQATKNEIRFPNEFGAGQEYCETVMGHFRRMDAEGVIVAGVSPFENICDAVAFKDDCGNFTLSVKTEYTEGMLEYTSLKTERAFVSEQMTVNTFFDTYRALLPQSTFPMPKLVGWNTWDYYLDEITADDVFENATALKNMPFAKQIKYIVLDDGWQQEWGCWRENEKFACGLKAVADGIRNAGFTPGIWMTPVGIRESSALFREHNDWLCRDEKGELLTEWDLFYLDPTHPDVKQLILDNYRYQYEAGFRLFKMDYISSLLRVKNFHDPDATPYGVLAELVRQVQECTGPDAVILGCSLPLECGADIAPSMRLGLDIHNHFAHVAAIARSISWSSVYNNRTTRMDPDFLIVRGEDTSDEPMFWVGGARNEYFAVRRANQTDDDRHQLVWRHGEQFNAQEAETWANLVAISGGNIFLSDRMSVLNERGIQIIDKAFQLAGENLRTVYLADDYRAPSLWLGDRAMLIVNWEDIPRSITVSGIDFEFTAEKPFVRKDDAVTVTLLPHESFSALKA